PVHPQAEIGPEALHGEAPALRPGLLECPQRLTRKLTGLAGRTRAPAAGSGPGQARAGVVHPREDGFRRLPAKNPRCYNFAAQLGRFDRLPGTSNSTVDEYARARSPPSGSPR